MDVALYQPEIPPNTGNVGRLCYCTASRLHIIGQPSFSLDAPAVRRAGLDYWAELDLKLHTDWAAFKASFGPTVRILLFSRFAQHVYTQYSFAGSDVLVFGTETRGLPPDILKEGRKEEQSSVLRIPVAESCRSLNLSNAVAVVLFEALRQQGFPGLRMLWDG